MDKTQAERIWQNYKAGRPAPEGIVVGTDGDGNDVIQDENTKENWVRKSGETEWRTMDQPGPRNPPQDKRA